MSLIGREPIEEEGRGKNSANLWWSRWMKTSASESGSRSTRRRRQASMVSCQSLRMQRDVAEDVGEHVVGHPRFNMAMGPRNPKTHEFLPY